MLPGMGAMPGISASSSMREIVHALGLTTSLRVLLDAGDSASYASGQVWTDLSGGGNHFNRGSGSGADAADPTFNGAAGGRSSGEYFSYDGADRFTLATAAPSWQSGMHKAGGKFTIVQWAYVGNLTLLAPTQAGFGCGDNTAAFGGAAAVSFTNSSSVQNAMSIAASNSAGAAIVGNRSTLLVTNNAWQMIATSVDVDAGSIIFAINGSTETRPDVGVASPDATDSHGPLIIGAQDEIGTASAINGCRIASSVIWTAALSTTQLGALFQASRGKFGI